MSRTLKGRYIVYDTSPVSTETPILDKEALDILEYRYRKKHHWRSSNLLCVSCGEVIEVPGLCWKMLDNYLCLTCGERLGGARTDTSA